MHCSPPYTIMLSCLIQITPIENGMLNGSAICGPRCVHWILQQMNGNNNTDLSQVVAHINFRLGDQLPSLHDLGKFLNAEGFYTRPIQFSRDSRLILTRDSDVWVIAHFEEPLDSIVTDQGHFAVWLHTSADLRQICWDGLQGQRSVAPQEFLDKSSGMALVVARSEKQAHSGVSMHSQPRIGSTQSIVTMLLILVLVFCCFGFKKRRNL